MKLGLVWWLACCLARWISLRSTVGHWQKEANTLKVWPLWQLHCLQLPLNANVNTAVFIKYCLKWTKYRLLFTSLKLRWCLPELLYWMLPASPSYSWCASQSVSSVFNIRIYLTGIRSVPLKNAYSEEIPLSSLLVNLDLRNAKVVKFLVY